LVSQNERMQKRLAQLGFAMALEPVPNFKGIDPHALDSDEALPSETRQSGVKPRTTTSSHTAGRSAYTTGRLGTASSGSFFQRPMKRQRLHSPLPNDTHIDHPSSRDAMPPPRKSMSRMQSVRKMFPSLRKKFSSGRSRSIEDDALEDSDVQMYDNGRWQDVEVARRPTRDELRGETPYMSGALPVERSPQASGPRRSQLLGSVGFQHNESDFTFRASSPVKTGEQGSSHRPVHLPTEPSYIRLMDGLSRDNGVELGLKDPRQQQITNYCVDSRNRQVPPAYRKDNTEQVDYQRRWSLGQHFMHQSPYESSLSVNVRQHPSSGYQTNGYTNRAPNAPALSLATPAPRRQHHPTHQIESVVSPYFRNGHDQAQFHLSTGLAEPQDSSDHSGDYHSQRSRANHPRAGWVEPRSLNGLSFFDSPVDSRNEPIKVGRQRRLVELAPTPLPYQRQRRHLNPRGFITRPEDGDSLYTNDSVYGPSQNRDFYNRNTRTHFQTSINVPPVHRPDCSRIGQVPSIIPSIVPSRPPARVQSRWENLQRVGVRSSCNAFGHVSGNNYGTPSRNVFPNANQRNVRR
jgi:hypothetical protein